MSLFLPHTVQWVILITKTKVVHKNVSHEGCIAHRAIWDTLFTYVQDRERDNKTKILTQKMSLTINPIISHIKHVLNIEMADSCNV